MPPTRPTRPATPAPPPLLHASSLSPAGRVGRREALSALGAGALLASGCSRPPSGRIVPYREAPEGVQPGEAQRYATSATREGHAVGLLMTSHVGRPTKAEGHPR